jgi:glutaredoxin 3
VKAIVSTPASLVGGPGAPTPAADGFCSGRSGYGRRMELYQAEWCPHSHRVRQRLTELGLEFVARQVPAEPAEREAMHRAVGADEIPVLVDGEQIVRGDEDILAYLGERYEERPDADVHHAKAREEVREFEEIAG